MANQRRMFEVIGPGSRGYKPAQASIDGDAVILTSEEVKKPVAFRFAWNMLAEPNLTGGTGLPVGAFRGGEEPDLLSLLSIENDYQLVYDLDLAKLKHDVQYDVDNSDQFNSFDRIGYLLELDSPDRGQQKVFVSMNAFTEDAKKIGIPTVNTGARFQRTVQQMDVFSSVDHVTSTTNLDAGNIEFWPDNYGPVNKAGVPGASSGTYDFGDEPSAPTDGYGSMQVHNFAARQTVFAINHWGAGAS